MKLLMILIMLYPMTATSDSACYSVCKDWDTFCKSPEQIIATKCRLGVPVYHEQCRALGVPDRYLVRGGGSLVDGMPCTAEETKNRLKDEV